MMDHIQILLIGTKNNVTIALNVLYAEKQKMYPDFVLKQNSNCEKQVNFLMTSNGDG